jgi:hypothetical protein
MKPWSKAERIAFALTAAGVLSSLLVLVHPWYDLQRNDASIFIITARAIAAGDGYTYLGSPFQVRPVGFPLILAALLGDGKTSFFALNLLVSLLGAAGALLLFVHHRQRLGWAASSLTVAAVWLSDGYRNLCNQVMSDVPGLALVLLCLLVERWASRAHSWRREIALGLAIGFSANIRSAALILLPAIALSRLWIEIRTRGAPWTSFLLRRLIPFLGMALLVVLPWFVRDQVNPAPIPADQTLNYSIGTAMWHADPGDPRSPRLSAGEILERPLVHGRQIVDVLGSRMRFRVPPGHPPPDFGARLFHGCVTLILIASLLWVLFKRRAPAEFFALGSFLIALFYFGFADRLLLPVFVLGLAAVVEVLRDLLQRFAGRRAAAIVVPFALLLGMALDFDPRRGWSRIERTHQSWLEAAEAVGAHLRPDARLASSEGFHWSVYLNRPVFSLAYGIRRAHRVDSAEDIIDKYGLNTVVLSPHLAGNRQLIPYFEEHYGPGISAHSAILWRVRP